ncbi:putative Ig domain-containing protein [Microcoleus sp. F6_B4]
MKNLDFGNTNAALSNVPPSFLTQPPKDAMVGQKLRYRAVAADPNGDVLSYELTVKPDGMVVDAKTGLVSWLPTSDQMGVQNAVLRVTDGNGGVDLQSFSLNISPPNALPVFLTGPGFGLPLNPTAVVGQAWKYQPRASDADNDSLAFGLVGAPEGVKVDPATGLVSWTPKTEQVGNHSITVTTSDGRGQPIAQTFNIEVSASATNSAPTITSTPRLYAGLNQAYFYNLQANDPNGDPLTYTLETAPSGMTIDPQGRITWQPTPAFFGSNPVKISVSDGRGGISQQEFTLNVGSQNQNQLPSITSVPSPVATVQKLYQYDLTATDPDGDPLFWSLDAAPVGMSIDPETGKVRWNPSPDQIGTHDVALRVMDASGAYVGQAFTLNVRGVNAPPGIISSPPTLAAADKAYKYQVLARDAENDPLTFSLVSPPNGMTINPKTGLIQWTPSLSQAGVQNVGVLVSDSSGATASQQYALTISQTAINLPPAITSTPVFTASPGRPYTYQVTAADADGSISQYQLLQSPTGMTINPATGVVTWNNPTAGNHQVVVGAVDNSGTGAAQGFELIARANSAAVIPNIPIQSVSPGASYRYDLKATDANGDLLTFALIQSPSGMTVDEFGRISWKPSADNIGNHPVEVKVTDTFGESVTVSYNLSVVADTVAPKVSLIASNNTVDVGDYVTFTVNAVDNVKVESLALTINGTPVVLDAQGQANVKVNNLGSITAVATAKDAAGNVGNATQVVAAIDTSDVNAPTINISLEDDAEITAPVNIVGTISDSSLAYYTLEVAPVGGGQIPGDGGGFKEVYRGTAAVNNGTVATFDPTVLANGAYVLKFTAFDANGNGSTTEKTVNVSGDLKLGNFRLSFTDLSVPVAGIPINVTRTYDSLNANASDDFGYGWRMEFRDTDLKTSLKADSPGEELGINTVAFDSKTKVFITLPGGKRETFTFKPTPHHLNQYLGGAGPGAAMYKPAFESQKGSTMTLTVKDANLVRNEYGEYYGVNGQPFNPENPAFGSVYVLTTKEGLVYEIDAKSGDLLTATDANGNKLSFSDAGIASSSGKSVTFERDAAGRIVGVVDPDGKKVKYEYDGKGDLVAVKDRENNATRFEYEDEDRPHFLTEVIDSLGRSGVKTEYDESGRLKQMVDANGSAVELVYDPNNSIQKVKDVFGKETTYVYDSRGNVLTEIDPLGKRIDRTYDADNNVLTETVITSELNAAGNPVEVRQKTEWTYDSRGNKLSEKDPLGNVARWTYNSRGQVLTETDALGNTASYTYSPSGNLLSTKDAAGKITQHSYDARGLRRSTTDANNKITRYEYDNSGNLIRQTDALGNDTTYTYNNLGKRLTETRKVTTPYGLEELVTEWKYDAEGRVESVIDAEGYLTKYEYDANDNRTAVVDGSRRRTEYVYNEKGQLKDIIYPDKNPNDPTKNLKLNNTYDAAGRLVTRTDESGRVTQYKYDDAGRLTETIYPDKTPANELDNPRTKVEYYKNGNVKAEIDERGNRTEYRYNANNELVEIIYPDGTPDTLADNPKTVYQYDAAGRRISETNARNRTTNFVYDKLGRLTETRFPDNTKTTATYDALGRRVSSTDRNGKVTKYEYNAAGKLTAVVQNLNQPGVGLIELRTEYSYDEAGRLTGVKDANTRVTEYEYDLVGRPLATILPDEKWSETYYDGAGNVIGLTDFNGNSVFYDYDSGSAPSVGSQNPVRYAYTPTGKIASIVDSRGTTSYKYDERDRLISRTDPSGPYTPNNATIEYGYDAAGNITSVAVPSGTTNYTYDERNRLKTVTDPDGELTTYFYDPVGNLSRTELPNGVVETRTYDDLNQLKLLEYSRQGTVFSKFDYTLDAAGNRRAVTELNGRKVEYEYDELYRVTQETITDPVAGNRTVSYTYDSVGNRLSRNDSVGGVTTYVYDSNDRLKTEVLKQNNVVVRSYEYGYDDNGNAKTRIEKNAAGNVVGTATYSWDKENRLIGVQTPDGNSVSYAYDADGIRVSSTVNGVKTDYLVDGNRDYAQVLEERVNNSLGASYVYGLDLISQERGAADSFYLVDGLGSTRGLANGAGGVTDVYNYDAFGNLIGRTGSTVNNYLFAGEQYDSNLGGYYLRKRYYDEYRGRFTAQDPFEGWMSDPMSLHNYLYAHGNPVNAIDPSGLFATTADYLNLIFAAGALAAIGQVTLNTVFTFKEGTPNEFPPAPPPFPIPRPSEPEILINKPPADGFPPSPEPFPVPQPEKPEPLITRVPLLGLKEYLDNYVFQAQEGEIELTYKPSWDEVEREAARRKIEVLNEYLEVNPASILLDGKKVVGKPIGDKKIKEAYKEAYERINGQGSWPRDSKGEIYDVDHIIDLQFGGLDTVDNMWPLPASVNGSLGSKINNAVIRNSKALGKNPVVVRKITLK